MLSRFGISRAWSSSVRSQGAQTNRSIPRRQRELEKALLKCDHIFRMPHPLLICPQGNAESPVSRCHGLAHSTWVLDSIGIATKVVLQEKADLSFYPIS
ncbi:MAG: hypothetical protein F6K14_11675 [Symploca sp. SIO2C1]|nr:hypothetical protein [Symploca sp. SIO2C1]